MLDSRQFKPITGTFVTPFINDTGINNWGRREWEADFRLMKSLGIDTIIVLRCEYEQGGRHFSGFDPRGTTWPEDPDLVSMYFRLCDENNMDLYLGGVTSCSKLYRGDWQGDTLDNEKLYERMLEKFGNRKCFRGFYVTCEALPWHYNYADIVEGICDACRRLDPKRPTLLSPTFNGLKGDMSSHYSPDEFREIFGRMFDRLAGKLDFCAWQDKFNDVECDEGRILPNVLDEWYEAAGTFLARNKIALWANVESFYRPFQPSTIGGEFHYRQNDYRVLAAKMQAASRHAEKLITFEFSTCMSPNAEWGSAGRLLQRYIEMVGIAPETVAWPEDTSICRPTGN